MFLTDRSARFRFVFLALVALSGSALVGGAAVVSKPFQKPSRPVVTLPPIKVKQEAKVESGTIALSDIWKTTYALKQGETVEISVGLARHASLPPNGRIAAEWTLAHSDGILIRDGARKADAFGIYTLPTANWRKVLHALDPDVYLIYRAPKTGKYVLQLTPVTDEPPVGDGPRWREKGGAPQMASVPKSTPWPKGTVAPVRVSVKPINVGTDSEQAKLGTVIECEPNDTPEQAQNLPLSSTLNTQHSTLIEVTGGADDVEFFDNGKVGRSGDDWFRIEYRGKEPRLLTAQLSMPGQVLAARIRAYSLEPSPRSDRSVGSSLQPLSEYFGKEPRKFFNENKPVDGHVGRDPNERVHQQDEEHRANITRMLYPGETYFLRVEANAPGYQLQVRLVPPPPYTDPQMAIRQGMYTHIGQVDAWLTNRPRGASIERRIRDSGNMMGTNCMSCHTQSGVWGPAVPIAAGYRPQNIQNYWHLQTVMYECLRPTNVLKEAANNTSLAPLDVGDGPAGTRAAGFNIVNAERVAKPRALHSVMQIRTANYVLQTADPGGINAADKGSNVGRVVVYLFATEILKTAWQKTGDPVYFRSMEQKAREVLKVDPRYTDDIALRLDFFNRVFPIEQYVTWAEKARIQTAEVAPRTPEVKKLPVYTAEQVKEFAGQVRSTLLTDERRLRAIQNDDGSWGFNPGYQTEGVGNWTRNERDRDFDPSPTALGITALTAAGYGMNDPAVSKAVKSLLAMQEPSGRWNRAAITGFVTTSYALHALARLFPVKERIPTRVDFAPKPGESLLATVARVRSLALNADPKHTDLMVKAAKDASPLVRYWAYVGLGATHTASAVPSIMVGIRDTAKPVRDAATWALRMTLLDDKGWQPALIALEKGDDFSRAHAAMALNMRADAVMPEPRVDFARLGRLFDRAMNQDAHPAVRAWSAKAAWQWWVWNPPIRSSVNAAWVKMLTRPESNALVENSNRYSSQALFIVNGHKANGSKEHQYKELATLFETLIKKLDSPDSASRTLLARRLVAVGGTFFTMAGSDGGPGQMGYITPSSGELIGKAALIYLQTATKDGNLDRVKIGLEGGTSVPYQPLTAFLVDYSLKGPDDLRQLAASAVSDPRTVSLAGVPELVQPQLEQVKRGAMEPPRRNAVSDPIINLWAQVNWAIPQTEEQQRAFFDLIIPKLDNYVSPAKIAEIADPAERQRVTREMDAAWYLADRLGEVMQKNPDLHKEIVFRHYFPPKFRNPLEEHYWIRSVEWLLIFNPAMVGLIKTTDDRRPTTVLVSQNKQDEQKPDEALTIKDRALQLYLDALKPTAKAQTRAIAIQMSNQTALRTNPEVLRALTEVLTFEKDAELRKVIENVLKQSNEKFMPDLLNAIKSEKHASVPLNASGDPQPTKPQIDDIVYFRDYVMPELSRQKRTDQQSCVGCHGVRGRVPTFYLEPPDKFGYVAVKDLLINYRTVQSKVLLSDIEKSKILRKPLNIQDGQEDGHQGGRRYAPNDPEYLLLRKWVENQPKVQKPSTTTTASTSDHAPTWSAAARRRFVHRVGSTGGLR